MVVQLFIMVAEGFHDVGDGVVVEEVGGPVNHRCAAELFQERGPLDGGLYGAQSGSTTGTQDGRRAEPGSQLQLLLDPLQLCSQRLHVRVRVLPQVQCPNSGRGGGVDGCCGC